MKLVICWTEISGYMAACWRALALRQNLDLFVIAYASNRQGMIRQFGDDVMAGIPCRLLLPEERNNTQLVHQLVAQADPDVLMIPGWAIKPYVSLLNNGFNARVIMGMDTPRKGTLRQWAARYWLRGLMDRVDRVMVPGERSYQYAMELGVPQEHIHSGLYCTYVKELGRSLEQRLAQGPWPRCFVYMGRYAPEKGLDTLLEAYRLYRASVIDPWPLRCYGCGRLKHLLKGHPGVEELGFVQPADQPTMLAQAGAFVLASRYEPWGLVLVEACAAGLPIICTSACGSAVEVVRTYYNGLVTPPENANAIASAMRWMDTHYDALPAMGQRAYAMAQAYDAGVWAARMEAICDGLNVPVCT